MTGLEIN